MALQKPLKAVQQEMFRTYFPSFRLCDKIKSFIAACNDVSGDHRTQINLSHDERNYIGLANVIDQLAILTPELGVSNEVFMMFMLYCSRQVMATYIEVNYRTVDVLSGAEAHCWFNLKGKPYMWKLTMKTRKSFMLVVLDEVRKLMLLMNAPCILFLESHDKFFVRSEFIATKNEICEVSVPLEILRLPCLLDDEEQGHECQIKKGDYMECINPNDHTPFMDLDNVSDVLFCDRLRLGCKSVDLIILSALYRRNSQTVEELSQCIANKTTVHIGQTNIVNALLRFESKDIVVAQNVGDKVVWDIDQSLKGMRLRNNTFSPSNLIRCERFLINHDVIVSPVFARRFLTYFDFDDRFKFVLKLQEEESVPRVLSTDDCKIDSYIPLGSDDAVSLSVKGFDLPRSVGVVLESENECPLLVDLDPQEFDDPLRDSFFVDVAVKPSVGFVVGEEKKCSPLVGVGSQNLHFNDLGASNFLPEWNDFDKNKIKKALDVRRRSEEDVMYQRILSKLDDDLLLRVYNYGRGTRVLELILGLEKLIYLVIKYKDRHYDNTLIRGRVNYFTMRCYKSTHTKRVINQTLSIMQGRGLITYDKIEDYKYWDLDGGCCNLDSDSYIGKTMSGSSNTRVGFGQSGD